MPFAGASPSIREVEHLAAIVPSLTVSLKFRASEVLACRENNLDGENRKLLVEEAAWPDLRIRVHTHNRGFR